MRFTLNSTSLLCQLWSRLKTIHKATLTSCNNTEVINKVNIQEPLLMVTQNNIYLKIYDCITWRFTFNTFLENGYTAAEQSPITLSKYLNLSLSTTKPWRKPRGNPVTCHFKNKATKQRFLMQKSRNKKNGGNNSASRLTRRNKHGKKSETLHPISPSVLPEGRKRRNAPKLQDTEVERRTLSRQGRGGRKREGERTLHVSYEARDTRTTEELRPSSLLGVLEGRGTASDGRQGREGHRAFTSDNGTAGTQHLSWTTVKVPSLF